MIRHRLLCLGYFDFGSVGLFSLGFLSLFAVQTQRGQNAAADEQSSQPTDEVAAVTGLRRLGGVVLSGLIGVIITAACIAGVAAVGELVDDRILAVLGAANGAFLVLDAGGLLGSGLVDHPLEAVCCRVGLVAALAFMPVIGVIILPIRGVAVGMAGRRILIGGLELHIVCGHGEGGGCLGGVCQGNIALQHDPLVKDLAGLRCVRRNGDLNALHGAGDGCACGNGCRAAGDGNGVILQGGDLGVLAALSMAAGAFLVLLAGLTQRRFLIHYPYPGMLGGFGVGGAVRHLADGAVAAVCRFRCPSKA